MLVSMIVVAFEPDSLIQNPSLTNQDLKAREEDSKAT
mgnify:CR=1 FL=1